MKAGSIVELEVLSADVRTVEPERQVMSQLGHGESFLGPHRPPVLPDGHLCLNVKEKHLQRNLLLGEATPRQIPQAEISAHELHCPASKRSEALSRAIHRRKTL